MLVSFRRLTESDGPPKTGWTKRYDYDAVTGQLLYEGWAWGQLGAATSDASWSIVRYSYSVVAGNQAVTLTQWANGTSGSSNIWDNRAALSYK